MATLTSTNPTLQDVTKTLDGNGSVSAMAEILTLESDILNDLTMVEGNLPTGHRGNIRTGIPEPAFRKYNSGTTPTKTGSAVVTANTAMMEAYSEVDVKLAKLAKDPQAFVLSESRGIIQGFSNKAARYFFYGNEGTEPEAFTGLSIHYSSLTAANGENVITGAGSGSDNGSIWLVVHSPETIHAIYPQNSKGGLSVNSKGQVTVENASGSGDRMEAYRTHFEWDLGLFVKDWRFGVRIPNIDKSDLNVGITGASANLPDLMYQALEQIPNLSAGRPAFYMSRAMRSMVRRQVVNATKASSLTIDNVGGKMIMAFQGVPMGRVDALNADETLVT